MRSRSSEQEDYLVRIIKQAAEALRRLRERLVVSGESSETVRRDVDLAIEQLLGTRASILARLDARTAVRLVGSGPRVALWADLLEIAADACDRSGGGPEGSTHHARATALRAAAAELGWVTLADPHRTMPSPGTGSV